MMKSILATKGGGSQPMESRCFSGKKFFTNSDISPIKKIKVKKIGQLIKDSLPLSLFSFHSFPTNQECAEEKKGKKKGSQLALGL